MADALVPVRFGCARGAASAAIGRLARLVLAGCVALEGPARAEEPPLSPGSVALLALEPQDEALAARIGAALASPDASVRGAAARVAGAVAPDGGCAALKATLGAEKDAEAAREEIRAAAALCPDAPAFLTASLASRPAALRTETAFALARRMGLGAGPLAFGVLLPALGEPAAAERFFRIASRGSPESVAALAAMAAGAGSPGAFRAIARNALRDGVRLPAETLRAAMTGAHDEIAGVAAWLAALTDAGQPAAERAEWSSLPRRETADPDTLFAFDVLRRVGGGPPPVAAPWLEALRAGGPAGLDDVPKSSPVYALLTPDEKSALASRRAGSGGARALARPRFAVAEGKSETRPVPERAPMIRTATDLPRGVGVGAARATGCSLARVSLAIGEVGFRPQGTPEAVNALYMPADAACRRAALALFALSLTPGDDVPRSGPPDRLAVVFDADALAALDEDAVGTPVAISPGGPVKEPKEVRRVKPEYPESLRKQRLEGAAVLTARIDVEGRVKDLRVVVPAGSLTTVPRDGTSLDLEALRAVARWRYEPARIDGTPVPVLLTTRVSWSLSSSGPLSPSTSRR